MELWCEWVVLLLVRQSMAGLRRCAGLWGGVLNGLKVQNDIRNEPVQSLTLLDIVERVMNL